MANLMILEPDGWAEALTEVQRIINNSESKVTTRIPFEMKQTSISSRCS